MKKQILIFFLLAGLAGCDKFLDIKPKGEVIPETAKDFDNLLNSQFLVIGAEVYPNIMTDDVHIPTIDEYGITGINTINRYTKNLYTFQKEVFGESESDNYWSRSYNRIYNYNTIIERVLSATHGTESEKRALRAEALVGRAFDYLMLVNAYAKHYDANTAKTDLAVPLILTGNVPDGTLTRATVEEIYQQIKNDLTEAEEFLPENPKTNTFRASAKAVKGIFARMYLYLGEYEKALSYANSLLTSHPYLLDLKSYHISRNPEVAHWHGRIINYPYGKDNKESIYLKFPPNEYGLSMSVFVSQELLNLYDLKNDKRALLYFSNKFYGWPMEGYAYMPYIYVNVGISTPEIYLIAAECEARIGNKNRALQLINTLRDHRILNNAPLTAGTNEEVLKLVLDERRRELLMGVSRFIDLRRLNREPRFAKTITRVIEEMKPIEITEIDKETGEKYSYTVYEKTGKEDTYTLEANSPRYVLPIPPKILRFNPGMPDNER